MLTAESLVKYHPTKATAPSHKDKVSVVMVTFNKYQYIRELIQSFKFLNYNRDLLEIVVVDNNSNDGTEERLKEEFGDEITLIQTGANLGGSGGFNTGMRYVIERHNNKYIWLLDNDVVVHPDSLNWLLTAIKSNPDAAAVGSMILQLDNPDYLNEIGADINWLGAKTNMHGFGTKYTEISDDTARVVEYCAAASLLKTRAAIEKTGFWKEFFIHFDDVEWCLRAKTKGLNIYCEPKSIVFHESMHKKQPTWIKYYNIRNLLYLYASYKPLLFPLPLAKFSLWVLYFKLHGYDKNSGLIAKAIADFFQGKIAKQDFPLENYQSYASYNWQSLASNTTLVFYDAVNLLKFLNESGWELSGDNNIILYNQASKAQILNKYPNCKILKPWAQVFKLWGKKSKVIFDGSLEGKLMLPSFCPKLVVYPQYQSLIDL